MGDYTLNGIHYKSFGEWEQAYFKNKKEEDRNNMKAQTITQTITKRFILEFEKFDDWVYIKCSDHKQPYLLPRKFFDKREAKHAKSKNPYNWLLAIKVATAYYALSEDYLKQYFEKGLWSPKDHSTWIVDPLPLLKAGVKDRYYQAEVHMEGFLRFDSKLVRRPYPINLHDYRSKGELVKKLLKNPKILHATIEQGRYYDDDDYICIIYLSLCLRISPN